MATPDGEQYTAVPDGEQYTVMPSGETYTVIISDNTSTINLMSSEEKGAFLARSAAARENHIQRRQHGQSTNLHVRPSLVSNPDGKPLASIDLFDHVNQGDLGDLSHLKHIMRFDTVFHVARRHCGMARSKIICLLTEALPGNLEKTVCAHSRYMPQRVVFGEPQIGEKALRVNAAHVRM